MSWKRCDKCGNWVNFVQEKDGTFSVVERHICFAPSKVKDEVIEKGTNIEDRIEKLETAVQTLNQAILQLRDMVIEKVGKS